VRLLVKQATAKGRLGILQFHNWRYLTIRRSNVQVISDTATGSLVAMVRLRLRHDTNIDIIKLSCFGMRVVASPATLDNKKAPVIRGLVQLYCLSLPATAEQEIIPSE
jgi:hypothetical protein